MSLARELPGEVDLLGRASRGRARTGCPGSATCTSSVAVAMATASWRMSTSRSSTCIWRGVQAAQVLEGEQLARARPRRGRGRRARAPAASRGRPRGRPWTAPRRAPWGPRAASVGEERTSSTRACRPASTSRSDVRVHRAEAGEAGGDLRAALLGQPDEQGGGDLGLDVGEGERERGGRLAGERARGGVGVGARPARRTAPAGRARAPRRRPRSGPSACTSSSRAKRLPGAGSRVMDAQAAVELGHRRAHLVGGDLAELGDLARELR